jgi:hypothetical protein
MGSGSRRRRAGASVGIPGILDVATGVPAHVDDTAHAHDRSHIDSHDRPGQEPPLRTAPPPVPFRLLAALVTGGALVAACGGSPAAPRSDAASASAAAAATPPAPAAQQAPLPSAAELDAYRPADLSFYRALQLEGAAVVRPQSLPELQKQSTVVVLARVVGAEQSRVVHGTSVLAVVLRPQRVLGGRLQADGDLRVETLGLGPQTPEQQVAELRAGLPQGLAVWFLRWQGTPPPRTKPNSPPPGPLPTDPHLYAMTHAYAVLVQGKGAVVAPLAGDDGGPVGFLADIRAYRTMSGLVHRLAR